MLSTTVIVKTAPTQKALLLADGHGAAAHMPTEAEMREAIALCTKQLNEMYESRGYSGSGWQVDNFDLRPVVTGDGDVLLVGAMTIRRDH